ncbi:hypothetical protein ACHAXH_006549, partial [Discostella pseudostelligera]
MKQTNPNVYPISQDAKMVLLERLKQEISSKVIVDATKNRKRKRGKTTNGGSSVGDGDDAQDGVACASAAADGASDSSPSSKSFATTIVRSRLIVGTNQCTRILEEAYAQQHHRQQLQQQKLLIESTTSSATTTNATKARISSKPSLLLLSKDVLRPPSSILDHITIFSRHLNVPTLVLPGRASSDLGQALGMKCAAVALILSSSSSSMREDLSGAVDDNKIDSLEDVERKKQREEEWTETNQDIDSFVSYAINKVPK